MKVEIPRGDFKFGFAKLTNLIWKIKLVTVPKVRLQVAAANARGGTPPPAYLTEARISPLSTASGFLT